MSGKNSLLKGYPDHYRAEFRLVVLKALKNDPGHNMSDSRLHLIVKDFGFKIDRDFLATELLWLEDKGAIQLRTAGTAVIAELRETGDNHLERITPIVGVQQPSLPR